MEGGSKEEQGGGRQVERNKNIDGKMREGGGGRREAGVRRGRGRGRREGN